MAQRYEKEMKKADKKNIIIKYKQYLKLEKSLSANTVEAYLTDLDKLFAFLELENIHFADVTLENLETFYNGILKNFRNGNVSLIDFTDFMESYRQTVLQVYEMKKQIMISAENLSQLVQTKIFY